jgi:hypothetical protein
MHLLSPQLVIVIQPRVDLVAGWSTCGVAANADVRSINRNCAEANDPRISV